jgi:hypothetical protein
MAEGSDITEGSDRGEATSQILLWMVLLLLVLAPPLIAVLLFMSV